MINPQLYSNTKIYKEDIVSGATISNQSKLQVSWKDLSFDADRDELPFMKTFNYPDLSSLKKQLSTTGQYTDDQLNKIVEGLAVLPEYRD